MASKSKSLYVCSNCGYENPKWYGRCPQCGEWDCLEQQIRTVSTASAKSSSRSAMDLKAVPVSMISNDEEHRYVTGIEEFDRVLGGGIVKGSLVLLSGDPGIGKSTILLQVCNELEKTGLSILYVSGEESAHQIKLRAQRLTVTNENLFIMCETDVEAICEYIRCETPGMVIIDSIQTMMISDIGSTAGSVVQVRESTNLIMKTAKSLNIPTIIVGHVNKDGNIAGPKVLEHIVDAVLYFEGEKNLSYRILRAVKNRYGSTNEIGVFEMSDRGLAEVRNPSMLMISGRPENTSGTCIACAMEGTRPILAEVQALVTSTAFGNPRRQCSGFDYNRLNMLLAVLEKRGGYYFSNMDAYLNVVGGMKLTEPAADLSVVIAMISSLKDAVVPSDVLAFGEIGLAGEVRGVSSASQRVKEAARLGFRRCVIPHGNLKSITAPVKADIEVIGVKDVKEAYGIITG